MERVVPRDRASLERAAALFAAAPRDLFVYPRLELDKDLARGQELTSPEIVPSKDEPLLVLDIDRGNHARVLAADGLTFDIDRKYLVDQPAGTPALPARPRALSPTLDVLRLGALLPPGGKSEYDKAREARQKCLDKAWEPYRRQLPTVTHQSDVEVVFRKTAAESRIEEAGLKAMDKACGTELAFAKKVEGMRTKVLAAVEVSRVPLLATARANFK